VVGDVQGADSFFLSVIFLKAVGAMAAVGLAAPAPAQVIGLGENDVWAFVIELARLGDGGDSVFGIWGRQGHASIFADGTEAKRRSFDRAPSGHLAQETVLLDGLARWRNHGCQRLVRMSYHPLPGVLDLG
jgi:hypothetical protein